MGLDHISIIQNETARLVELLNTGPLTAPVPGCPDWNLGDLGVHMVGVQRWATGIVRTGQQGAPEQAPPAPGQAADALRSSCEALVRALSGADPADPCWNFTSEPQTMQFWFRRQALEIAVHRYDAEAAISATPSPIDTETAAHVVDEFVHVNMQRIIERQHVDLSGLRGDVHLHCTDLDGIDGPGEWTFEISDGSLVVTDTHRKCAVAARGSASDLALFLYRRIDADALEIFGDPDVLKQWSVLFAF